VADGVDAELLNVGRTARGGPKYEAALTVDIASLNVGDRIRLVGWADREMVAELLSAADVFCLASYTEGWPNVVQEALACGTPVVATHVGGVPQMIPSSEYGIIVPPKDEAALQRALRTSLATEWDRERIATWGRRRGWADVAQEVSLTFEGIVRESTTCGLHEDGPRARRTGA
jgi:glycosyltransferase involved in cell wall biosynthesis